MSLELQKYTISYSGKAGKDLGSMKVIHGEEGREIYANEAGTY